MFSKKKNNEKIFLTGNAEYIGSHTCVEMIESGYIKLLI